MLRIRESQLEALSERPANSAELAAGLRDLAWFDKTNHTHLRAIGAVPGASDDAIFELLTRFIGKKRGEAAGFGVTHEYLVLHYAGFFFKYGEEWPRSDDAAAILADPAIGEETKMQTIAKRLRLAYLLAGGA
jgi:hypothetical protein